ncbi:hypothetical protein D3C75_1347670 [compost metagenome]
MHQANTLPTAQVHQRSRLEGKGITLITISCSAVVQQGIHRLQALHGFAQWPGGQAAAITQASSGID